MSKYVKLWEYIRDRGDAVVKLSFDQIETISGTAVDHSFLKYKKELSEYGYEAGKISMKEHTVIFQKKEEQKNEV